jgi:hypothetical protein
MPGKPKAGVDRMISGAKMHRTSKSDYFVQLWERALVAASCFRKLTKSPKPMISSKTLLARTLTSALGFIAGSVNAQIIT